MDQGGGGEGRCSRNNAWEWPGAVCGLFHICMPVFHLYTALVTSERQVRKSRNPPPA